jgi:hypothetical protein
MIAVTNTTNPSQGFANNAVKLIITSTQTRFIVPKFADPKKIIKSQD